MRLPDEPDIPGQINIVPMIDIIFAILTFFIIATLFLNRSEGLPVNLPQAQTAKQQMATKLTLTIDPSGQLSLNRRPIALADLQPQVRQEAQSGDPVTVIINADEAVNHGLIVAIMDQVRQVPGAKLAIATQKP
ncbi:ExbD/TolR family protein [Lyngbya confervoides]|uniref:Biopolymer transporter ExbD n=1 Tax=Lyngbya confervoides BDU141951 TaxID=1574623 RepID=A0ABD4T2S4_9CYAN|nr:biopolymer transporter ExbD [Lyngbya confervoides]MCM1982910.1 biopolymer transporter ExbD [Lyngbya confervoides BDU141951]